MAYFDAVPSHASQVVCSLKEMAQLNGYKQDDALMMQVLHISARNGVCPGYVCGWQCIAGHGETSFSQGLALLLPG
jgi:hypothetical protein